MKKLLTALALTGIAASALAQGTINFANSSTTLVKYGPTSGTYATGSSAPINTSFVELLWAEPGTAAGAYSSGETLATWLGANQGWNAMSSSIKAVSPLVGRFSAGTLTANTTVAGEVINAIVIGWSGGSYATYDAAVTSGNQSVYAGFSSVFTIDTGNPNATPSPESPAVITTSTATPFTGIYLTPLVPEPSSLALAGLGAAAMLIFRRRK